MNREDVFKIMVCGCLVALALLIARANQRVEDLNAGWHWPAKELERQHIRGKKFEDRERGPAIEIGGVGGTCLRCGKDFFVPPDENGAMILTPLCPDCQRKAVQP